MKKVVGRHISGQGFTIVELLVVIVVIGILAAIIVVAYNGIQGRALDSRRLSDAKLIIKALEMYKINNGTYPAVAIDPAGAGSLGGWESSAHEPVSEFVKSLSLAEYGLASGTPVDPVNNIATSQTYLYYKYGAGTNGCSASLGAFFVFGIKRTTTYGSSVHPDSPGFSCSSRNWQPEFSWVTGKFDN